RRIRPAPPPSTLAPFAKSVNSRNADTRPKADSPQADPLLHYGQFRFPDQPESVAGVRRRLIVAFQSRARLAIGGACTFCARPSRGQWRQRLRVEGEAMAGTIGRNRLAVRHHQRMLDIAVEAKTMRLEIEAVRAGGEQMHGDVVRAVTGDGQVEGLREPRDL